MSNVMQSLWIGNELSNLEKLSIKSFIDNGHEYHLYTYGNVKGVPEGTVIKDANEIVQKEEIFTYKNGSYSAFSNYWRFYLLFKKGGWWVDTDLVCVKSLKDETYYMDDFVFASEPDPKGTSDYETVGATTCMIKMKKSSMPAWAAISIQKEHKPKILSGEMHWGSGPATIKEVIKNYNLEEHVLPWSAVCSCGWNDAQSLVDTYFKPKNNEVINKVENIPKHMIAIHFWNQMWKYKKFDKNRTFHQWSLYEQLKGKYFIHNNLNGAPGSNFWLKK